MDPKKRKDQLIRAGLQVAEQSHYTTLESKRVARLCGVSYATLFRYFPSMDRYRKAVLRRAIKDANLTIVAQAMAQLDPMVRKAPPYLLNSAVERLKSIHGI